MSDYQQYRVAVHGTAVRLAQQGRLVGTGGNVSMRVGDEDLVAITPSAMDYLSMTPEDICVVDFERNVVAGTHMPSVETGMHISVYKTRRDVNAVIHTHQIYPSVFAIINRPIPALFDEQVANLGREVAVVPYGLSGSVELLENITVAVDNQCNAFILQNHGALVLGLDLTAAERNVVLLEKAAQTYYHALALGQPVSPLPPKMEETIFDLLKSEQRKEIRRKKKASRTATGDNADPAGGAA